MRTRRPIKNNPCRLLLAFLGDCIWTLVLVLILGLGADFINFFVTIKTKFARLKGALEESPSIGLSSNEALKSFNNAFTFKISIKIDII